MIKRTTIALVSILVITVVILVTSFKSANEDTKQYVTLKVWPIARQAIIVYPDGNYEKIELPPYSHKEYHLNILEANKLINRLANEGFTLVSFGSAGGLASSSVYSVPAGSLDISTVETYVFEK